jgi:hypothetical protein
MPNGLNNFETLPPTGQKLLQVAEMLGWTPKEYGFGSAAYHIKFLDQFENEASINFGVDGAYQRDGRVWTVLQNAPPPSHLCEMDDEEELIRFVNASLNAWYDPKHDPGVWIPREDMPESPDDEDLQPL